MEINETIDLEANLNDKRNIEVESSAETLYKSHCFMADMNTVVHYIDNVANCDETVLAKLVPSIQRKASGISHYIYSHQGTIGALVYVRDFFSAHLYCGKKPKGNQFLHVLGGEERLFTENELEHYVDFFIDDNEDKMFHVDLAPGLYEKMEKEIQPAGGEGETVDNYIFDGLLASIETLVALGSEKEIESTTERYKRVKRIDPYITFCFTDENDQEVREKIKMTIDSLAVLEENQRYVINVSMFTIDEYILFNKVLLTDKKMEEVGSEGFLRAYDVEMVRELALRTPDAYVVAVLETTNGNFNINYDKGTYVGYSYKQAINARNSYVVIMDKEQPANGYETILTVYDDFGHSFTQPLSKENADYVFKQMINIRPNLHEDYIDGRKIKDVESSIEEKAMLEQYPFKAPEEIEDKETN